MAAACAAVLGQALRPALEKGFDNAATVVEIALIAVGTLLIAALLRENVFSRALPRRLVLGRDYVEGRWVDAVMLSTGERQLGITELAPSGGSLRYSGTNFATDGTYLGSFQTTASRFDGDRFEFLCDTTTPGDAQPHGHASGALQFDRGGGRVPDHYRGWFMDDSGSVRGAIAGIKVEQSDVAALEDPQTRVAALLRLTEGLAPT